MSFSDLGLSDGLLSTLRNLGYETPTPIQAQAIPPVLAGRDLLGCAQTGTGKTAAFALPMIDLLSRDGFGRGRRVPRVLILAPTRELAGQICDSLDTYGGRSGLRHTTIYGGVSQHRQVRALDRGVDILVATPGRLIDLIEQGFVDLSAVEILVLDEADRMLDMGFIQPIRRICSLIPSDRQTKLFSATMSPTIRDLASKLLRDPEYISIEPATRTAATIDQSLFHVPANDKPALAAHLLLRSEVERAVVFTRTKHGAEKLAKVLGRVGLTVDAIHGNKSQNQRQRALDAFKRGRTKVLVATDVAARGLDVDGITHVLNFNIPNEPESYVHRIGRTGRAGASGTAWSMCASDERGYLRSIERLTGKRIPVAPLPERSAESDPAGASQADDEVVRPNSSGVGTRNNPVDSRPTVSTRPMSSTRPEQPRRATTGGKAQRPVAGQELGSEQHTGGRGVSRRISRDEIRPESMPSTTRRMAAQGEPVVRRDDAGAPRNTPSEGRSRKAGLHKAGARKPGFKNPDAAPSGERGAKKKQGARKAQPGAGAYPIAEGGGKRSKPKAGAGKPGGGKPGARKAGARKKTGIGKGHRGGSGPRATASGSRG